MYNIIVNGKKFKSPLEPYEPNDFISYNQVVGLIHPKRMQQLWSITWKVPRTNHQGILNKDHYVKVSEGMVFSVIRF